MVPSTNKKERRKYPRFKAVNGAFAAVRQNANQMGQIQDISVGGLAFKYLANEGTFNGARTLDIFIIKQELYIKDIPIQLIRDTEVEKESPYSTVPMRQQSVQFGELSVEQRSRLIHLMQYHTVGES
ncbi:MAG: PilZ domain-containing protein [Deltaproteobacteria bacterium]|nr:PilZ domain-containing protein [Deltaproteobacteria bacterium]MBW2297470.1 PilZ domain-containing protein [Deltaproteobacteria bacterium]MBW2635411.1 PilZ domain-containing protein [Deltaproteobacteria bacterium]